MHQLIHSLPAFLYSVALSFTTTSAIVWWYAWKAKCKKVTWYEAQHRADCLEITKLRYDKQKLEHQIRFPSHY